MLEKATDSISQEDYEITDFGPSVHTLYILFVRLIYTVQGSQVNVKEFISLLRVIEATNFSRLSPECLNCSSRKVDHSQGRSSLWSDLLYY